MLVPNYEIFAFRPSIPTWDILIERVNDIPPQLRDTYEEIIIFFKEELGKGFFKNCSQEHPLIYKFTNAAPWQIYELKEWADTLKWLKQTDKNYDHMLTKIKKSKKFQTEGIWFLELATFLRKQNLTITFPPEVQSQSNPDAEVFNPETGELFYIEVSQVNIRSKTIKSSQLFFRITDIFFKHGFELPYSMQLLKAVDQSIVTIIIERIKDTCEIVRKNESFIQYADEYVKFAIAHPIQNNHLEEWCKQNNTQKGAYGLPVDFNETPRIISNQKIRTEADQIPKNQTGILFMPVEFLYFLTMDKVETLTTFKNYLSNYPHIQSLVLYCAIGQPLPNVKIDIPESKDLFIVTTSNDKTRYLFYITNPTYNKSLSVPTIDKFRQALNSM